MGRLVYESNSSSVEIDDRTLAHLRIVVMSKLRRGEAFMFDVELGERSGGRRSLWLHPAIPLVFHFYGSRHPSINRTWLDDLMRSANSPDGLILTPERVE